MIDRGALAHGPLLTWQATGAQLLTAEVGGWPMLYCSPWHNQSARQPARGGVPVLFPQFADRGPLKKHGWARDVEWRLVEEVVSHDIHRLQWEVQLHHYAQPDWPYSAYLVLSAEATADSLALELRITNTGNSAFSWTGGLHPYWAVDDIRECSVAGLNGAAVQDRFNPGRAKQACARLQFTDEAFEVLHDTPASLTLTSGPRTLQLSMAGFDQWMIWNPGATEARQMADLPDDGWKRFVCIEPVRVSRPCPLQTGETFRGVLLAQRLT